MGKEFTHLHCHGDASISDGLFSPKKWVAAYGERGFSAAALTDHGTMTNLLPFYKAMRAEKKTPILGVEFYFAEDPTLRHKDNRRAAHIILLAKNYEGFRNLMRLSKLSYTEGFYAKPRIGFEWIEKHREGLVCLSACQGGVLSMKVWDGGGDPMAVEKRFDRLVRIFGGDFYVEFQGHKTLKAIKDEPKKFFDSQAMINKALYGRLSKRPGFQPVVTNDCHYILPEHARIQSLLKSIAYRSNNSEAAASYTSCDSLWLKSGEEVFETIRKNHEYIPNKTVSLGIENTIAIFEKCKDLVLPTGERYLPSYKPALATSEAFDSREYFLLLCKKNLKLLLSNPRLMRATQREYIDRFKKEYAVISEYHLQDYFLIVWDLIRFARSKGIYCGIGRGSAAGCLISYLFGIVKIDPLEHGLLFERFLNEHRCESGELPDIDLDVESLRRTELKDYIFARYGRENVCEIGTYGRMQLKTAIIDFGKALRVADQKTLLSITTSLDLGKEEHESLEAAIESNAHLKRLMVANPDYAFAVDEIIGQIKTQAVHPAGLLICSEPIAGITPLKTQKNNKDDTADRVLVTQAEDKQVIAQGLMKMDVLGIKEYDVVRFIVENAACKDGFTMENYVEKIMSQERREPNAKVWKMFRRGNCDAVFQFSSQGMRDLLKMMRPDSIRDLTAANALYRPGCLENGWHIKYCERKHGREPVHYPHPIVESVLGDTYGVCVYQEQVMSLFHLLGGVSLSDSDTIRSALGKKDKEKLAKFESQFVSGAAKKIGKSEAAALWAQLEKSTHYSFNKSHAAVYAVLAYISQYLKIYYPTHFWAAQIDWDIRKNSDDLSSDRSAAVGMGVQFVLPDVNRSKPYVSVDGGSVVWPLGGLKGIGPKTAEEIAANAPYKSFEDCFKRVNKSRVKINHFESLIYGGAFDELGDRRECLSHLYESKGRRASPPSDEKLMLSFYESIGFFERKLKDVRGFDGCITEEELRTVAVGEPVVVGGMIGEIRGIKTKKGEAMGFATLIDLDESIEATVFPAQWVKFRHIMSKGSIVQVTGTKSGYGGKPNLIEVLFVEEK